MKIQSLSIVVPNKVCINHCATCPSRMHDNDYDFHMDINNPMFDLYLKQYIERLEFARHNGCNTLMLTGTSEPQQNKTFLTFFGMMMKMMRDPFQWIEMQTTGVGIDRNYLRFLRNHVGVSVMAISTFALDSEENKSIINPPKGMGVDLKEFAADIKDYDFTLRVCCNLTKYFNRYQKCPEELFKVLRNEYKADQLTLRVLYESGTDAPEDVYVRNNSASFKTVTALRDYIIYNGKPLGVLPYGATKYSINGMSVVLDDDSMGKANVDPDLVKYLILRPDCKLYSSWDDKASLVF